MSWTALIALKPPGEGKSRLAPELDSDARKRLALAMLTRLRLALEGHREISRITLITKARITDWPHDWLRDQGRGLNEELEAATKAIGRPALAIHADLPLVETSDIAALLQAAERNGLALAPDRHGTGTNAVALSDARAFHFRFGQGSFVKHRADATAECAIVRRDGLSLDCDTMADLALAREGDFSF